MLLYNLKKLHEPQKVVPRTQTQLLECMSVKGLQTEEGMSKRKKG